MGTEAQAEEAEEEEEEEEEEEAEEDLVGNGTRGMATVSRAQRSRNQPRPRW